MYVPSHNLHTVYLRAENSATVYYMFMGFANLTAHIYNYYTTFVILHALCDNIMIVCQGVLCKFEC